MKFTTHLFSPNNTGSPDYNICGQASSIIAMVNTTLVITISDGITSQNLITTSNLAGGLSPVYGTYTFGDLDINFSNLVVNTGTGSICATMDFFKTGTTDVCTWRKIYVSISVSKVGYQPYNNVIQMYGYDIGNDFTLGISGNTDFDIYLINNTNNLDINGKQTKAFSKFAILRQPFTKNVYFYNLVGTQGTITYYNTVGSVTIGSGAYGTTCVDTNACNNNDISIKQRIQVFGVDCSVLDTCETTNVSATTIWLPVVTSTNTCPEACNDCINDIATTTASVTVDYTLVTPFNIDNTTQFLSSYLIQKIDFRLLDFQGTDILDSLGNIYTIDYATWLATPAVTLVPITFDIVTPPLGDCTLDISSTFNDATDSLTPLIACDLSFPITVCHWWTVAKGDDCGKYIFNNCSSTNISIVLQQMQDDKSFADILTIVVPAFSNQSIDLQADGVYLIKVPSRDIIDTFEYYSITNFCRFESCWLTFLNKVLCATPTTDCTLDDHYKFNVFLINAHTFFMALNEEYNFSFIYTSISDEKIEDLYTLSSFITRFNEYCNPADDSCIPCNS